MVSPNISKKKIKLMQRRIGGAGVTGECPGLLSVFLQLHGIGFKGSGKRRSLPFVLAESWRKVWW